MVSAQFNHIHVGNIFSEGWPWSLKSFSNPKILNHLPGLSILQCSTGLPPHHPITPHTYTSHLSEEWKCCILFFREVTDMLLLLKPICILIGWGGLNFKMVPRCLLQCVHTLCDAFIIHHRQQLWRGATASHITKLRYVEETIGMSLLLHVQ